MSSRIVPAAREHVCPLVYTRNSVGFRFRGLSVQITLRREHALRWVVFHHLADPHEVSAISMLVFSCVETTASEQGVLVRSLVSGSFTPKEPHSIIIRFSGFSVQATLPLKTPTPLAIVPHLTGCHKVSALLAPPGFGCVGPASRERHCACLVVIFVRSCPLSSFRKDPPKLSIVGPVHPRRKHPFRWSCLITLLTDPHEVSELLGTARVFLCCAGSA